MTNSPQVTLMESSLLKALPLVFFGGEITSRRLGDDNLVPQYDALVIDREVNVQCDQRQSSILMVGLSNCADYM